MSAPAFDLTAAVNASLLAHHPVKLEDARTLAPTITCDTIRGDLANALQLLGALVGAIDEAPTLFAVEARLRSALAKVDDLFGNERANRATILGQQQELDALHDQLRTIQPIMQDIENLASKAMTEIRNR